MGSYRTYSSLVKLQPLFLSLQWKICLWAELWALLPEFAVKDLPVLVGATKKAQIPFSS